MGSGGDGLFQPAGILQVSRIVRSPNSAASCIEYSRGAQYCFSAFSTKYYGYKTCSKELPRTTTAMACICSDAWQESRNEEHPPHGSGYSTQGEMTRALTEVA